MSNQEFEKKEITKKSGDFARWYNDVVLKAKLADYAPVRGSMVIRPYGFALWGNIQAELDQRIKESGAENAYFPLLIPYSLLEKEAEHVEGFSPELAVVTHGGGKELSEPLVVRPTSETVMYPMFSKWIKSWRDLPLKINQWCNVVRWERRTYLFLRTLEFLWQEGHTAHVTSEEAEKEALDRLEMYREFAEDFLALPVICGRKSATEKFPGAVTTYAFEALMPDGKALQCGTSHNLGQNFSKVFDIKFQDEAGNLRYVFQTSWGVTTRLIGALVMVHGDDNGLILPPKVAPVQAVIIPIASDKVQLRFAREVSKVLKQEGVRVEIDNREEHTPGWKYNEWELKGVPVRVEIGANEVKGGLVTLVRRDTGEKLKVKSEKLKVELERMLGNVQKNLYQKAKKFLWDNTYEVENYEEFKKIMFTSRGLIKAYWCGSPKCEAKIKEETKATIRALPLKKESVEGASCVFCGKPAKTPAYFAQAY